VPSVKYPRLVWVRPQALGARQAHRWWPTGTRATTVQVRDDVKVLRYPVTDANPHSGVPAFCQPSARGTHAAARPLCMRLLSGFPLPAHPTVIPTGAPQRQTRWARCLTSSSHLDCLASRCSSRALTLPLDSRPSRLNVARDRCTLLPLMPPRPSRLLHTWPSRLLHTWPSRLLLIAPFSLAA
jgi:hypothetical protein